jgi:hypothetical protein
LAVSDKDFWRIASSRGIIANVNAVRWNEPKLNGKDWLTPDEVTRELVKPGPPVLGDVLVRLGPNTISGEDRRPWISVIKQIGSEQDVPALIATMLVIEGNHGFSNAHQLEDNESVDALNDCLEKLTKTPCTDRDKLQFWTNWWNTNAPRVVRNAG